MHGTVIEEISDLIYSENILAEVTKYDSSKIDPLSYNINYAYVTPHQEHHLIMVEIFGI